MMLVICMMAVFKRPSAAACVEQSCSVKILLMWATISKAADSSGDYALHPALTKIRGTDSQDMAVQAMRLKHGLKFRMTSVALKMAGHKKVANMIISSWKVCHCPCLTAPLNVQRRHDLCPSGSHLAANSSGPNA